MNNNNNKVTWEEAELDLVRLLHDVYGVSGYLVDNTEEQYKDIDVRDRLGHTYSVKYQGSSEKTGNIVFENGLENTDTGEVVLGSFSKCSADYYVNFIVSGETKWAFIGVTSYMKDKVVGGNYRTTTTKNHTNSSINGGRFFNKGHLILVPVKELYNFEGISVFYEKDGKWYPHLKRLKDKK